MDEQRSRIQEDLRGLVSGEVRCDDIFVQLYASDASIYQIRPLGVVRPRNSADVVACLAYARDNQLSIHARGAGSGLAGESLGSGIVLDFSTHFRRILETGATTVRVQPGVVHERLNAYLRPLGRMFGPDPAMSHVTTLGSVAAVDSSGSHWLRYGSARDRIASLAVVLPDGHEITAGREPLEDGASVDVDPVKRDLINRLVEALRREAQTIADHWPRSLVNRCGYEVRGALSEEALDLRGLLIGSEGTLALTTELTLVTDPLPRHRGMALLFFDRLETAARAVAEVLSFGPCVCDILDRRHLGLARESDRRFTDLIPPDAEAVLLVERDDDDPIALRDRMKQLVDRVRRKRLAFDARTAFNRDEVELFERLPKKVVQTLYRMKGSTRAIPFVEDIAVPPDSLAAFFVEMQNILKRHQVTASLFGHAGHGQLHLRPFLDLSDPQHTAKLEPLAADLYEAVWDVGGTISGEHADGLSRTQFVPRQYGELYRVFREIKRIFDPYNILNPGKIIGDDSRLMSRNLRPAHGQAPIGTSPPAADEPAADSAPTAASPFAEARLNWNGSDTGTAAASCNGCGACRAQDDSVRMCPIFRFAPAEEASPRAKANLVRGVLSGRLPIETIASSEFKDVADLCVNCKMCRLECPASVDIPQLMIEAKAAHAARNGLAPGDWLMVRLDWFGAIGSQFHWLANWILATREMRWLLDKLFGIAQGRKLPRFAARTFMRRASRRRLTQPTRRSGGKVVYFVDAYANYHDPQLGEALVAVMEHNGIAVYVPPAQRQSAMAMVSLGALDRARRYARRNIRLLADAVRQGYTIVTTEPSAALCLTQEYPALLDDDDARLVADNCVDACQHLWQLHQNGKLQLDLKPINASVGYHEPCHVRALGYDAPGEALLRLIPGLVVQRVERGCSGMAGTFGLSTRNYRASLRAGLGLISAVRDGAFQAGATECSACKMQMEQGSSKPTIHPLKLLAHAYRMMPETAALLTARSQELTVT